MFIGTNKVLKKKEEEEHTTSDENRAKMLS